ncbi:hypothetical protein HAZT_HAZT005115 [Hyalella azteca]|uniref:Uncharacterized protein n=1 Tax=Hyalella azteca TaxID=294128 RepID=A0A6A0GZZ7_HYAAZ|nr:hypothetical protein HAZT_HAZT005115 [Hyalella azteca]
MFTYVDKCLVLPGLTPQTPAVDPANLMVYQQNLQRAYIQSAVAQNIQIQQHLMAQNQALQQLLTPNLPVSYKWVMGQKWVMALKWVMAHK